NSDIVGVQELTRNHPSYQCEDQPKLIAQQLSSATGRSGSYVYKQEWTTTVNDCHGDTPETEGIGFFAPAPIAEAGSVTLWNGRLGSNPLCRGPTRSRPARQRGAWTA